MDPTSSMPDDAVTADNSGAVPRRVDKRGLLHMLHDELGKQLGMSHSTEKEAVGPGGKTVDELVTDAVNGAPKQPNDY